MHRHDAVRVLNAHNYGNLTATRGGYGLTPWLFRAISFRRRDSNNVRRCDANPKRGANLACIASNSQEIVRSLAGPPRPALYRRLVQGRGNLTATRRPVPPRRREPLGQPALNAHPLLAHIMTAT
jgi:hypothetical protein